MGRVPEFHLASLQNNRDPKGLGECHTCSRLESPLYMLFERARVREPEDRGRPGTDAEGRFVYYPHEPHVILNAEGFRQASTEGQHEMRL